MLNRWLGIVCFALMGAADVALFVRDVLPSWTPGDRPAPLILSVGPMEEHWLQTGLFDAQDRPLGHSWTRLHRGASIATHETYTYIHEMPLPDGRSTPPVQIRLKLVYQQRFDRLDELFLHVFGLPFIIRAEGQAVADQFPISWRVADRQGSFILDAETTAALGNALAPFQRLERLQVGQTWRMELFNPLAGVLPGFERAAMGSDSVVVRVTRHEKIQVRGRFYDTLRVEAPHSVGWVTDDGRVVLQEVSLPLFGRLIIRDEPFRKERFEAMDAAFRGIIDIEPESAITPEERESDDGR